MIAATAGAGGAAADHAGGHQRITAQIDADSARATRRAEIGGCVGVKGGIVIVER